MAQSYLDTWNQYDVWKTPSGGGGAAPAKPDPLEKSVKDSQAFMNNYIGQLARNEAQQAAVKREQVFQTRATPEEKKAATDKWKQSVVNSPAQKAAEDRLQKGASSGSFHPITQADHDVKERLQKGAYSGGFTVVTKDDAKVADRIQKGSFSGSSTYLPATEQKEKDKAKALFQQTLTDQIMLGMEKRAIEKNGGTLPAGVKPYVPKSTQPRTVEEIKDKMTRDIMQKTSPTPQKYAGDWQRKPQTVSQIQYDMNNRTVEKPPLISPDTPGLTEMQKRAAASNPSYQYQQKFGTSTRPIVNTLPTAPQPAPVASPAPELTDLQKRALASNPSTRYQQMFGSSRLSLFGR